MWVFSAWGIYPIITLLTVHAGPLLLALGPPLRFAIVSLVLSAVMTWLVMPAGASSSADSRTGRFS